MKLQNLKRQMRLQEWASQINTQRQSGLKVKEWCEENGIGYKCFYYRMKRVQEEMLEALEAKNTTKTPKLAIIKDNQLPVKHEAPVFTPVTIPQSKCATLTVWIGHYAVDIQNGADAGTIDQVLRMVSRL